jgi:hypothetical protein
VTQAVFGKLMISDATFFFHIPFVPKTSRRTINPNSFLSQILPCLK